MERVKLILSFSFKENCYFGNFSKLIFPLINGKTFPIYFDSILLLWSIISWNTSDYSSVNSFPLYKNLDIIARNQIWELQKISLEPNLGAGKKLGWDQIWSCNKYHWNQIWEPQKNPWNRIWEPQKILLKYNLEPQKISLESNWEAQKILLEPNLGAAKNIVGMKLGGAKNILGTEFGSRKKYCWNQIGRRKKYR